MVYLRPTAILNGNILQYYLCKSYSKIRFKQWKNIIAKKQIAYWIIDISKQGEDILFEYDW